MIAAAGPLEIDHGAPRDERIFLDLSRQTEYAEIIL